MPKQIHLAPSGPEPIGPYSVATEARGLVFLSGQLGIDPDSKRPLGDITEQTHQVMKNIGAVLDDLSLEYSDIVKTTVFLADISSFPQVNSIYEEYLGESKPARSTIQAGALPGDFLIEIEVIAAR